MTYWKGPPPIQPKPQEVKGFKKKIKIPEVDLQQIQKFLKKGFSVSNIAHMFGLKDSIVYGILRKGKPLIMDRQPPFEITDKKIRNIIAYNFEWEFCQGVKKEFTISRSPNNLDEITIKGIAGDYKFKCTNIDHITVASERCSLLNQYFFQ